MNPKSSPAARIARFTIVLSSLLLPLAGADKKTETGPLTRETLSSMSLQETYRAIADRNIPAVVSIQVEATISSPEGGDGLADQDEFFRRFFGLPAPKSKPQERRAQAFGSGFLISKDGYLISNDHVVKNAKKITVKFANETKEYEAKLIGTDPDTDLALLKIDGKDLPFVSLGNSDQLKIGDIVVAIGNPFGLASTFTTGVVSATGRNQISEGPRFQNFIQSDVAINPGNSGGPLINIFGEVVGINSMILSRGGGNIGIAFSIPITLAKEVIDQLKAKGSVTRGWLGVVIVDISPEMSKDLDVPQKGVYVPEVSAGSPAEKAGVKAADIILEFDGKDVKNTQDLINRVGRTAPGSTINLLVQRANKKVTLKVVIEGKTSGQVAASAPKENPKSQKSGSAFGLVVQETRGGGVIISSVDEDSPFREKDVRPGDVIRMVNYEDVGNLNDYNRLAEAAKGAERVIFHIQRGSSLQPVVIRPKK
ncbi:MAG: Do family serine endopeptidase [Spirochaetia bacterium]|nr:Do family serine endopeptidase [Spirochaetia bacterium]